MPGVAPSGWRSRRRHAAAATKLIVCQAARNVCGQAVQLHGGIGMTEENLIGHYFKRAVVASALLGGHTTQEAICAAELHDHLIDEMETLIRCMEREPFSNAIQKFA